MPLSLRCYSSVPPPVKTVPLFSVGSASGKGDASDEDDDNEFFDAMEDPAEFITVPADPKYHRSITVCFSDFVFLISTIWGFF